MTQNNRQNEGSIWRRWDLQIQTILDDGYISLSSYCDELKRDDPEKWNTYVAKIGGEKNAILFDSKEYFLDKNIDEKEKCRNYARNLFTFVEIFQPSLNVIGFTDHNYSHSILLDELSLYSQLSNCRSLCGVEVNASGVHILVFFEFPPYDKRTFSDGITTFLDNIGINNPKHSGTLTVSSQSVTQIISEVEKQNGIYLYPHCNSDNGLFQERGKTDRTHLSDIFNHNDVILLQAQSNDSINKTSTFIKDRPSLFKSNPICSIASDSRKLADIGKSDKDGNYFWVKGNPGFKALRKILVEPSRAFIGDEPNLHKRVKANKTKFIKSISVTKVEDIPSGDIWFDKLEIELNSGLVAVIGNKGSGKSAITDIIGLCGNSHREIKDFSFLSTNKFRKRKPFNLSEYFEATLNWHGGLPITKKLNEDPQKDNSERVKYIPQNFLETICTSVESDTFEKELHKIIFSQIPDDQRFSKPTLEELIDYKSDLIHTQIDELKSDISKLNEIIILFEKKAALEYRASAKNNLLLKKNELEIHETTKPIEPDIKNIDSRSTELTEKLNKTRDDIAKCEEEIQTKNTIKKTLSLQKEELTRAKEFYKNIIDDLNKKTITDNEFLEIMSQRNIGKDVVFSYKLNIQPFNNAILEIETEIAKIEIAIDQKNTNGLAAKLLQLNDELRNAKEELDKPARDQQKYLDELKAWKGQKEKILGDPETDGTLKFFEDLIRYLDNDLEKDLSDSLSKRTEIASALLDKKYDLVEIRKLLFKPLSDHISDQADLKELYDVKVDAQLELQKFPEGFLNLINQGKTGTFNGKDDGLSRLSELIENATFDVRTGAIEFVNELIDNLKHDKRHPDNKPMEIGKQVKGDDVRRLYDFIFQFEYLSPVYHLKLGDKFLKELSPGERGALLLIFYLILDKDDIPLIIDQPEENLDNESVYQILVHFIKIVKDRRQIIIVTHNPNLAIVCDADQIIHMQIEKNNKNTVKCYSGGIEDDITNTAAVNILEGTFLALRNRYSKYHS